MIADTADYTDEYRVIGRVYLRYPFWWCRNTKRRTFPPRTVKTGKVTRHLRYD